MAKLRDWRVVKGLSIRELAKASGIDVGTISRIENGKQKNYRPGTMKKIADVLGLSQYDIDEFLPYLPPKTPPLAAICSSGGYNTEAGADTLAPALK